MKLRPLGDNVLVRRLEALDKTPGGIIIPENAQEKPAEGKVVAVGPGKATDGERTPPPVKVGDRVLFTRYAGHEVKLPEETEPFVMVPENEILAVYEE